MIENWQKYEIMSFPTTFIGLQLIFEVEHDSFG